MADEALYARASGIYQDVTPLDLYVFRFLKTQGRLQNPPGITTSPASSLFANRLSVDETATSIGNVILTQRNIAGDLILRGRCTGFVLSTGVIPVVSTAAHLVSIAVPGVEFQLWFTLLEDIGLDAIQSGWAVTEMISIFNHVDRDFMFITPRTPLVSPFPSFAYPSPTDVEALAPALDVVNSPSATGPHVVALSFSGKPTLAQATAEYNSLRADVKDAIPSPTEADFNANPASVSGSLCVASSGKYVGYITQTTEMMLWYVSIP
ncbi:hypothetical protein BDK51DRAFT_44918 [Blyttiomyces helicus]|uniref:Uncharacterized protein n=1 Tax=Blyttiomyces helicus TaxID=388810 RepID=A0A4P9VY33_9FUNG|nr:hypothetical protein BDK51DRAFT_44918 [Blyttiomyces helicus]|eukprot:RKO84681.1 hypothetical protein BDK51DRAFT_44918 [Blyttiomyces helicus]